MQNLPAKEENGYYRHGKESILINDPFSCLD